MSESTETYDRYIEALSALATVDARQSQALRKAVEASNAAEAQLAHQHAEQQRMYDKAAKDADEAAQSLEDLRALLGLPPWSQPAQTPHSGTPPTLVALRAQIREVAAWARESKPVAESLLRTKARITAQPPAPKPHTATLPKAADAPRTSRAGLVAMAAFVLFFLIVLAIVVTK